MKPRGSSLRKDTFLLTFSKVATMVINMVCVMLLSRVRTLEEYGTYSQLILVTTLTTTLISAGLPNSITYFLKKDEGASEQKRFVSHYYLLTFLISASLGVVLYFCRTYVGMYYDNKGIESYGFFLLFYPFALITAESLAHLLVSYRKTILLVAFKLIRSIALIADILAIYLIGGSFYEYMLIFVAIELLYAIAIYITAFVLVGGFSFTISPSFVWKILKFSLPIGLAYALGTITSFLDKLMISHWFSTEEYAIYANAAKELPIAFIASSTAAALMPRMVKMLSEGKNENAYSIWKSSLEFNFIVIALLSFGIICFSDDAIVFLYSEKYLPGQVVFCIYTGIVLLRSAQFGMLLIAGGQTKKILYVSIVVLSLNVLLNFLFINLFGFIGPAVATAIVSMLEIMLVMAFTKKEFKLRISSIIPFKTILLVIFVSITFAFAFRLIKETIPIESVLGSIGESVLLGCVWAVLYFLIFKNKLRKCWKKMGVD